jgi:hypothetical protein
MRNHAPVSGKCKNLFEVFMRLRGFLSAKMAEFSRKNGEWDRRFFAFIAEKMRAPLARARKA